MGFVYFIQIGKSGDIKIGYSNNIKDRMYTIQTSIPEKIRLLGYIKGDRCKEKEIHELFKDFKIKGEWFKCNKILIDYLNNVNEMRLVNNMGVFLDISEENLISIYGKINIT